MPLRWIHYWFGQKSTGIQFCMSVCVQMYICIYRLAYINGKVYRKLKVQLHTKDEAVNPSKFILQTLFVFI